MRIGYVVEGFRDAAFLEGLRARWCPKAEMLEGGSRGSTGLAIGRESANLCAELRFRRVDFVVILRDANREDWRDVLKRESEMVPGDVRQVTLYGVADRNIECWLCADLDFAASQLGIDSEQLRSAEDPKRVLDEALGGRQSGEQDSKIAALVQTAPLRNWIGASRSFERFYEDARDLAQRSGQCQIPNERARG